MIEKELQKGDILEWWVTGDANFSMGIFLSDNKDEANLEK
jgi:hypothetical protein